MSPTVLLVPGAWYPPSTLDPLREHLTSKGIASAAIGLPSIGADPATKTLDDDIAHLRSEILTLIDAGSEVILAAHSYGGIVASGAAEGLTRTERQQQGQKGGVVLILYMAAFALPKGTSLLQAFGGEFPPSMKVEGNRVYCIGGPDLVFHDLPPADQTKWYGVLTHTALAAFEGPATYEPWHTTQTAFIISEEDHGLPPPVQEQMAQALGTEFVYRLKSSHSAFMSQPERVAEILEELIRKAC